MVWLIMGVSVPEEFEIINSDDSQFSIHCPNLTTIAQPLYDPGAISMRMLTKIMHKEELEEREVSYLMVWQNVAQHENDK